MNQTKDRDLAIVELRPTILTLSETATSDAERFQNKTLRPILKLQNDLFIAVFKKYVIQRKNVFPTLTKEKKQEYIAHSVRKDLKFKNRLLGIIIGHLTLEEYAIFISDESELTRRVTTMLVERLQNWSANE